jgi:hypothetical protein
VLQLAHLVDAQNITIVFRLHHRKVGMLHGTYALAG